MDGFMSCGFTLLESWLFAIYNPPKTAGSPLEEDTSIVLVHSTGQNSLGFWPEIFKEI